jgi:hypothetical protein
MDWGELPLGALTGTNKRGRCEQRAGCVFVAATSEPPRDPCGTHFIEAAVDELDTGLYCGSTAPGVPGREGASGSSCKEGW